MQTLKSVTDQLVTLWQDCTAAGRAGLLLLAAVLLGGVVMVGVWSIQPQYVVLERDLTPDRAAAIAGQLSANGIDYQLDGAGLVVLVDKRDWARARLAVKDEISERPSANELESSIFQDPISQHEAITRNAESRLASTIATFRDVVSATVHLTAPKRSGFLRDAPRPAAAVVLELRRDARFGESQAMAIAGLVAKSVSGLSEEDVTVSDTMGRTYGTDASLAQLTKQESYRIQRERELTLKAETMLMQMLGPGNASVAITTDFEFQEGTVISKELDPDGKVVVSSTESTTKARLANEVAGGVAGAASNLADPGLRLGQSPPTLEDKEDVTTEYEVGSTERQMKIQTPLLNKMTVSVLINRSRLQNEDGTLAPEIGNSIESLVRQAVGMDPQRDQISIEFFDFFEHPEEVPTAVTTVPWDSVTKITQHVSLALAALIALWVSWRSIRILQPGKQAATSPGGDSRSKMDELGELVRENPEVFSKIIASWSEGSAEEPSQTRNAA